MPLDIVEVTYPEQVNNALKVIKRRPVRVLFRSREVFELVEPKLRKLYVLYSIISIEEKSVEAILFVPESFFYIDGRLDLKSYHFANPEVIGYSYRVSDLEDIKHVKSPVELIKYLRSVCRYGYRFIVLHAKLYPARGYMLCQEGVIKAVVYQNSLVYYGRIALRMIFYRGPYDVFVYNIRHRELRQTA